MKTSVIKMLAVLSLLAFLTGCAAEEAEVMPTPSAQEGESSTDYFSHPIRLQASTMAHDHVKANLDLLNAICDTFETSGKNALSIDFFPFDTDSIDKAVKTLPEELGNAIREYAESAVFCKYDKISIELYNLEYWRSYEEEDLQNSLSDPERGGFAPDTPINRILASLKYVAESKIYVAFQISRPSAVSSTITFHLGFSYYENTEDISKSDPIDGHWAFYGEYDVMSGL